jgi:PDZ domain-containing protein
MISTVTTAIAAATTTDMSKPTTPPPMLPSDPSPAEHLGPGVPPAPGETPAPPRLRRKRWPWGAVAAFAGLIGVLLVVGSTINVGYYALTPGSARPTTNLISVEDAETFPADGEVLFTTVHIERLTLIDYGRERLGLLPDSWEVLTEEQYLGPNSEEENDQINADLMTNSKEVASYVAQDHLGYDVAITGTGATIIQVVEGSPADGVLEVGDTIVAIDGEPIELTNEVSEVIGARSPGDTVTMSVEKVDGTESEVEVTLAAREDDASAGFLGVASTTRDLDFDVPVDVTIDSGDVGGPSAGLAFTLAILDVLTPGELTGGDQVAVTGTISPDGTVGPVGGVAQKVAAAADAGAEVFLVPADEVDQADSVSDDIRVAPVDDLDDALEVLSELGGNALALPTQPGA